ncbi:MAG: AMP-binding protein [Lutibacter sp.]|jgi:malonyl-CoA/methylmalonyl-CoA synthetase|nr:AMP-binding protein [Lutibacter sp.]
MLTLFKNIKTFLPNQSIISNSFSYSYEILLSASQQFASLLLNGKKDLNEARVAFMVNPGFDYVKVQWAIWQAGGIAVPLCLSHPLPSLEYVIDDTQAILMIVSPQYENLLKESTIAKNIRLIVLGKEEKIPLAELQYIDKSRKAMILYTSGTTNKPKGVVSTHANLEAQISTLVTSWEWSNSDHTLCVLPLHHVHGIVNVISCAMWSGATCEFIPEFSADEIFRLFKKGKINVFMAVPTIYFKLITYWESLPITEQELLTACMKKFRLMVCGSAALPVSILEKWKIISGHTLLERYGMTEIGMAISNPYRGQRRAGYVGLPLPGVNVKLVNENFEDINEGDSGEILVKGENVFIEYWNNPEATVKEFTTDGWFKTGDVAIIEDGYYRIMGRNSVDIIKSGGYKISALEIEEVLRTHLLINDCAVVGMDDNEWGELIVAALVVKDKAINLKDLNTWLRTNIAAYKTPRKYLLIDELPRNAMGKVTKNEVKKLFI